MQNYEKRKWFFLFFCAYFSRAIHTLYKIASGGNYFEFQNKNSCDSHERIDLYRHFSAPWNRLTDSVNFHVHARYSPKGSSAEN